MMKKRTLGMNLKMESVVQARVGSSAPSTGLAVVGSVDGDSEMVWVTEESVSAMEATCCEAILPLVVNRKSTIVP